MILGMFTYQGQCKTKRETKNKFININRSSGISF